MRGFFVAVMAAIVGVCLFVFAGESQAQGRARFDGPRDGVRQGRGAGQRVGQGVRQGRVGRDRRDVVGQGRPGRGQQGRGQVGRRQADVDRAFRQGLALGQSGGLDVDLAFRLGRRGGVRASVGSFNRLGDVIVLDQVRARNGEFVTFIDRVGRVRTVFVPY
jgi:hypothetical protein